MRVAWIIAVLLAVGVAMWSAEHAQSRMPKGGYLHVRGRVSARGASPSNLFPARVYVGWSWLGIHPGFDLHRTDGNRDGCVVWTESIMSDEGGGVDALVALPTFVTSFSDGERRDIGSLIAITIGKNGSRSRYVSIQASGAPTEPPSLDGAIPPLLKIHVMDGRTGQPLAKATVSVLRAVPSGVGTSAATSSDCLASMFPEYGRTEEDGTLSVGLEPGHASPMTIRVERSDYVPVEALVTTSSTETVRVSLSTGMTVTGRIVRNGASVVGVPVFCVSDRTGAWAHSSVSRAVTAGDGRFSCRGVDPSGATVLVASTLDADFDSAVPFARALQVASTEAEEPVDVGELDLNHPCVLEGVVVDAKGIPRSGARVSLENSSVPQIAARSDGSGRFHISCTPGWSGILIAFVRDGETIAIGRSRIVVAPASDLRIVVGYDGVLNSAMR